MAVRPLTNEDVQRLADAVEAETGPLMAVRSGKTCGVDDCHEPATAYPCEFCRMALCQDHTGSRVINGERYRACPHHARRDR